MAYDEDLADRVRHLLGGAEEKRMFGGLAFMVDGRMAVSISGQGGLLVKVGADEIDDLLVPGEVEPMVMGGRTSRTWVRVLPDVLTEAALSTWVARGLAAGS